MVYCINVTKLMEIRSDNCVYRMTCWNGTEISSCKHTYFASEINNSEPWLVSQLFIHTDTHGLVQISIVDVWNIHAVMDASYDLRATETTACDTRFDLQGFVSNNFPVNSDSNDNDWTSNKFEVVWWIAPIIICTRVINRPCTTQIESQSSRSTVIILSTINILYRELEEC